MTTLTYNEATFRATIKSTLEGISGIANVYDTQKLIVDNTSLEQAFLDSSDVDNPTLQGWEINLTRLAPSAMTFQGGGYTGTIQMDYYYDVVGWYAANDANETEKVVASLAIEVFDALVTAANLSGKTVARETPVVSNIQLDYRIFAGVLCHRIHLTVNPQEELL